MCCTEAERAKQLRTDELFIQEQERKSTVNQIMVQIQELQDKVNSLNDTREFVDPVPSQPMSIPSPRGSLSRDSCLQPDTRNSFGTENVFEDLPALGEPPAPFFGKLSSSESAPCEPVPLNTVRPAE